MITGPRYKIAKRLGASVFEKAQTQKFALSADRSAKNKKRSRGRTSEYGKQMLEKQKVRVTYGLPERQFRNYVRKSLAAVHSVQPSERLHELLEMRLDNVIFRAGFAPSRQTARQLVRHSLFLINGKKINIPSREVKLGDVISVKPSKAKKEYFTRLAAALQEKKGGAPSGWLEVIPGDLTVKVKSKPTRDDLDLHVNAQSIVEFYSR